MPPSTGAAPPPRSLPKNNEAQVSNTSPRAPIVETPISCSTTTENGNSQEGEGMLLCGIMLKVQSLRCAMCFLSHLSGYSS